MVKCAQCGYAIFTRQHDERLRQMRDPAYRRARDAEDDRRRETENLVARDEEWAAEFEREKEQHLAQIDDDVRTLRITAVVEVALDGYHS